MWLLSIIYIRSFSRVVSRLVASWELAAAKWLQSCPTVWPHRRQPTRLPRPWDSPGKNTGVGCHFLLQCRKVKVKSLSHVRLSATPWTAAYQAPPSVAFSRQEYWSGVPLPWDQSHWYLQDIPFKSRRIHLLKCIWDMFQNRPHLGSQIKSRKI